MAAVDREIFVGIDIGTTNTTACYIDPQTDETQLVTGIDGLQTIASVLLFINDPRRPNERAIFGNPAHNVPPSEYHVREVKRFVGTEFAMVSDEMINQFPIEECENRVVYVIPDPRNGEEMRFTPEELLAIEIGHLKKIINQRCVDCDFKKVVMTLPSSFTDVQIDALKLAYKYAGIEVITTMKEPSAAVYEYRMLTKSDFTRAMVIDIGGGTTDVCVVEQRGEKTTIKGNGGNPMLGGSDFDQIMMDFILERLEENGYDGIDNFKIVKRDNNARKAEKKRNINKLKKCAEKVKIELSIHQAFDVPLEELLPAGYDEHLSANIGRDEYEEKIRKAGLIDEIQRCIKESIRKSGIRDNAIEKVILVGGVTFMPIVRQMIAQMFGEEKIVNEQRYDPITAVAKGAARYAKDYHGVVQAAETGKGEAQVETVGDGIGVEGAQGMMEWIAKAGQSTPVDWHKTFTTFADNQDKMEFDVYKGESKYTSSNDYLTTYSVTGLERKPKGQIRVTFRVKIEPSGNMRIVAQQEGVDVPMQEMVVNCGISKTDREQQEIIVKLRDYFPQ